MSDDAVKNDGEGVSRRDFIKTAAVGASAVAIAGLTMKSTVAEAAEAVVTPSTEKPKLTMQEVLKNARQKLYPRCRVCPECNGQACSGEVPGFGGIGSGKAFRNNIESLERYQLNMRTFHEVKKPDTAITLFGEQLSMPILSAVTGGTTYNMGLKGKMSEEEYITGIIAGCLKAGTLGMAADGIEDPLSVYEARLKIVARYGKGMAQVKPRSQEEIIKHIRIIEAAGGKAVFIDIDSAGRAARALPGQTVEPKSLKQLKELVDSTKLPFVIKGVMTVDEAEAAYKVGAAGIVVSNHGGRVLDHTPGTAQVLPAIADRMKGKFLIFADGGVRYGHDVLKMLALGADAVLIGRPLLRAAVGGGPEGVALALNKMRSELVDAMVLTGTKDVRNVSRSILV